MSSDEIICEVVAAVDSEMLENKPPRLPYTLEFPFIIVVQGLMCWFQYGPNLLLI